MRSHVRERAGDRAVAEEHLKYPFWEHQDRDTSRRQHHQREGHDRNVFRKGRDRSPLREEGFFRKRYIKIPLRERERYHHLKPHHQLPLRLQQRMGPPSPMKNSIRRQSPPVSNRRFHLHRGRSPSFPSPNTRRLDWKAGSREMPRVRAIPKEPPASRVQSVKEELEVNPAINTSRDSEAPQGTVLCT